MAFQNRQQKLIIGWILQICLLVILSNPTGVAGIDFPSMSSFRGLRGAVEQKTADNDQDNFDYEDEDMMALDSEEFLDELSEEELEHERELHPAYYARRGYFGGYYRPAHVHYPYAGGYYGGYYNYYGYYNGYYRRRRYGRPFAYTDDLWNDWYSPGNFYV